MGENNLKKLLILTTYFPPAAEIAASRLESMIKYLLRLGWEIHVVTDVDPDYDYSSHEVFGKIQIYAAAGSVREIVPARKTSAARASLRNIVKSLPLPPVLIKQIKSVMTLLKYKRWTAKAYAYALKAIKEYQINTVLATVPRIEPLFVGARIKKKTPSIRLVCEYRDIISGNEIYHSIQSRLEYNFNEWMEKSVIPMVDSFIYLTEGIKSRYMKYKRQNTAVSKGIVLTNGYDGELCRTPKAGRANSKKLVINHVGHFYGSRSATVFSAAIALLSQEAPQIANNISVNFVGKIDLKERTEILRICRENNLSNICVTGPVNHEQAMQIMAASDVNLIITHQYGSEYALPGKIFEYIGAGKPILAVTADPLLTQLMEAEKLGWICTNQANEIKCCLEDIYMKWLQDGLNFSMSRNTKYEMGNIVDRLDKFLSEC